MAGPVEDLKVTPEEQIALFVEMMTHLGFSYVDIYLGEDDEVLGITVSKLEEYIEKVSEIEV